MKRNNILFQAKTEHIHKSGYGVQAFLIVFVLLYLSGCAPQKKVIYVPPEKRFSLEIEAVRQQQKVDSLDAILNRWKGVPYRRGGMSKRGIDCSGFALLVYKELYRKDLPRTTRDQSKIGRKVAKGGLKPGDLVFFKTGLFSRHVGVYYKDNRFIHASRSQGVMSSSLAEEYWRKHYWRAVRF